uniref:BTB domain-containing protein n=1 Tax=Panagrellus redivivus TaxID=6233 RepID=A0A7E4URT0_PANRE
MLTVKDSFTFVVHEVHLAENDLDNAYETPRRAVPYSAGLEWWVEWYPTGYLEGEYKTRYLSLVIRVTKRVNAKFIFNIGETFQKTDNQNFVCTSARWRRFAAQNELRRHFRDDKVDITIGIEFWSQLPAIPEAPTVFNLFDSVPTDFEFMVGSDQLSVHKNFLSLISPVFNAMFAHDTLEFQTGKVIITDFDFTTVKTAIGFCYGRELRIISVETYVDVLRFAEKYLMQAVVDKWEELIPSNLTTATICNFIQYAVDYSRSKLHTLCIDYFRTNFDAIKHSAPFVALPGPFVVNLLKEVFYHLETKFDLLHFAHEHGMVGVFTHLEKPLLESLALAEFSPTVDYAWKCSRNDLKKACAKFLSNNRTEMF